MAAEGTDSPQSCMITSRLPSAALEQAEAGRYKSANEESPGQRLVPHAVAQDGAAAERDRGVVIPAPGAFFKKALPVTSTGEAWSQHPASCCCARVQLWHNGAGWIMCV